MRPGCSLKTIILNVDYIVPMCKPLCEGPIDFYANLLLAEFPATPSLTEGIVLTLIHHLALHILQDLGADRHRFHVLHDGRRARFRSPLAVGWLWALQLVGRDDLMQFLVVRTDVLRLPLTTPTPNTNAVFQEPSVYAIQLSGALTEALDPCAISAGLALHTTTSPAQSQHSDWTPTSLWCIFSHRGNIHHHEG